MKTAVVMCAAVAAFAVATTCRAGAATEFCPARLTGTYIKERTQAALVHYYHLQALSPRLVEATILADTDQGWFVWSLQPTQLTPTRFATTTPDFTNAFYVAESPELSVSFPSAVSVRRAWVVAARTRGTASFGWDARGVVACAPPDFVATSAPVTQTTQRSPRPGDPTPAPAPPTAVATPTTAQFTTACEHPFEAAKVVSPARPDFPESLRESGLTHRVISLVYVAVDYKGNLADAWIFASSGYHAADQEALRAARLSHYEAPTSYCRAVGGTYLFRADFMPY